MKTPNRFSDVSFTQRNVTPVYLARSWGLLAIRRPSSISQSLGHLCLSSKVPAAGLLFLNGLSVGLLVVKILKEHCQCW